MIRPSWIDDGSPIDDPLGYGQRAVDWLNKAIHPKSTLPGRKTQLFPHQERIIRKIYGPRHPDGRRIVRKVVMVLPRGGRKTSLAALITLLHLRGPERVGNGLAISAAASHEQAREVFEEVASIVTADRRMRDIKVRDYKSTIVYSKDRVRYKAVASSGLQQHGKTPNVIIADELHAWQGKAGLDLWQALSSSTVKTPDNLLIIATTSGAGQDGVCWEEVSHAIKLQKGELPNNPAILPIVFMMESSDEAHWRDENLWKAVNPGMVYGFPNFDATREKAREAENSLSRRMEFQQFHLNRWMDSSSAPFVEMRTYDGDPKKQIIPNELEGLPCWIGVDMSATTDLSAVVAIVRKGDDFIALPHFFIPKEQVEARGTRDNVPYAEWARQNLLTLCPGPAIDNGMVEQRIRELCASFDVKEIVFDKAYGQSVSGPLTAAGFPVLIVSQGWETQSPALGHLERIIVTGHFVHGAHPVLRHHFASVAICTDARGNRTSSKTKSNCRIDGFDATWMAVGRSVAFKVPSFYSNPNFDPSWCVLDV